MTKKYFMEIIWVFVTLALIVSVGFIFGLYVSSKQIKLQQSKIDELNQEIGEYRMNEEWFEDYIDLLEEVYEGKINEAVLKERVKQLENAKNEKLQNYIHDYYNDYINQIIEDLDDVVEITIHYYENTDQVVDLVTYIELYYPTLYKRLLSYT